MIVLGAQRRGIGSDRDDVEKESENVLPSDIVEIIAQ